MTEKDGVVYTDGKYPNNNVDYIGIRLPKCILPGQSQILW